MPTNPSETEKASKLKVVLQWLIIISLAPFWVPCLFVLATGNWLWEDSLTFKEAINNQFEVMK